jgi:hypothetical protein
VKIREKLRVRRENERKVMERVQFTLKLFVLKKSFTFFFVN